MATLAIVPGLRRQFCCSDVQVALTRIGKPINWLILEQKSTSSHRRSCCMSEITSQSPAPLPPEQLKLSPGYGAPGYSPYAERKLRIWPGVVIVALMWAAVLGAGWMWPGTARQVTFMMFSPIIAGGLFALWWLLFS